MGQCFSSLLLHFYRPKWEHIRYLKIGFILSIWGNFEPQKSWSSVDLGDFSCPFIHSSAADSLTHLTPNFNFWGVSLLLYPVEGTWVPNQGFFHGEANWLCPCFIAICREGNTLKSCIPCYNRVIFGMPVGSSVKHLDINK